MCVHPPTSDLKQLNYNNALHIIVSIGKGIGTMETEIDVNLKELFFVTLLF